ncbi:hypothetical protein [Streptomyces sp. NPDC003077]|uniref:hypothetical protein n=1 Tax=Streptomyces sp. NPDC003077 TaxID=3154443 RepID=UPI0033AE2691
MRAAAVLSTILVPLLVGAPPASAAPVVPHESVTAPAVSGAFITDGDHVHVSSTPPRTASAHGWWRRVKGGTTAEKAKVTVSLQVRHGRGKWKTVATGSKIVKPGGGSARRANVRKVCANAHPTRWRSLIDVDIIGELDTPEKATTEVVSVACGVSG